jgi:hypothetical protein
MSQAPAIAGNVRGDFHKPYLRARDAFERGPYKGFRLMDTLLFVCPHDHPQFHDMPGNGEFAVVDLQRMEKAFFEMLYGATEGSCMELIRSHFAADPVCVADKLFVV